MLTDRGNTNPSGKIPALGLGHKRTKSQLVAISCMLVMLICAPALASRPVVAMITDFGIENEAVGLCHGVILSVNSDIQIVDLCHSVDAYDISLAGMILQRATTFPKGTVFVCVVDPGVGTSREPIAIKTKSGYFFVGPNNGVFSWVLQQQGIDQAFRINERRVNPKWKPGTFDGRDLFSPAGAILANSNGDLATIGDPIGAESLKRQTITSAAFDKDKKVITGVFVREDKPYGNMWTNVSEDDLTSAGITVGDKIEITLHGKKLEMPYVVSFGYVKEGELLAYLGSGGTLAVAINMGNFQQANQIKSGDRIEIRVKTKER